MINENTRILEHIFRNPKIEEFIKEIYRLRYEEDILNDNDLKRIMSNDCFIYDNFYNLEKLKQDIKTDTKKAIIGLGKKTDEVLAFVFPRGPGEEENFTRGFNVRCGPKGQYRKQKVVYPVKGGKEMGKIVGMSVEDFLEYSGNSKWITDEKVFLNPHGSYKPKKGVDNEYGIEKIHIRIKTPESLADKVRRYITKPEKEGEKIVDFIGLRIILDNNANEKDCYKLYENLKNEIYCGHKLIEEEDYIADPKPDTKFQSLKMGLKNDLCFEVQIRTKLMHDKAMRDKYNLSKNGVNNYFSNLLKDLFSARYL